MILSLLIKHKEIYETEIWRKKIELDSLKELLEETNKVLRENCEHNWVTDYIDDKSGEQSNMIIYCDKCKIPLRPKSS
tara:strand:+ start:468 stop:701 length:234 start_codon:yes stop_codon:yes gene_type:complete